MARATDLAADHARALGDAVAPKGAGADPSAVPAEARTLGDVVVGGSGDAHWRRLLALV